MQKSEQTILMHCVIVYAHPNPKSFCHALLTTTEAELRARNHTVVVRDLYAMAFNPVLAAEDFEALHAGTSVADVRAEQEHIRKAAAIVFIYPLWWTGFPALLKGYVDRVYAHGFAYTISAAGPEGLLKGKKVLLFTTQGTPAGWYEHNGMHAAIQQTSDTGIFRFCGLDVISHTFFPGVPTVTDDVRKGYLNEVKKIVGTL